MNRLKVQFILISFFLVPCLLLAQPSRDDAPYRKIPVTALRSDFRTMRQALEEIHPSLYLYTPKDSMDSIFDRSFKLINRPMTESEFMSFLYPVIRNIRCGHTQLEHSTAYRQSANRPKAVHLPFDVFVNDSHAWIVGNQSSDSTLLPGTELLSINGISSSELIQTAIHTWNGDGYNLTWNEFFMNEYDAFEDVCWMVYGWKGPYSLQVKDKDGSLRRVDVSASSKPLPKENILTVKPIPAAGNEAAHKRSNLNLRLMPDSATSILTVNGLEYGDEAFYKYAFQQMVQHKTRYLVLDIRRNHGGDARIINNLLSYLADSSYVLLKQVIGKVADPGMNHFSAYFDADITRSYLVTFNRPGKRVGADEYEFDFSPEMGKLIGIQPVADTNRFRGKVYVLIDGGTFSNGSNFAAALKAYCKNAVFVGRETGGTESGCGGGTNNKLTLPNSKLVLQFPWMHLVSSSPSPIYGRGLQPDYPIRNTPKSVAEHVDIDMEKAMELIKNKESNSNTKY